MGRVGRFGGAAITGRGVGIRSRWADDIVAVVFSASRDLSAHDASVQNHSVLADCSAALHTE